MTSCIDCGCDIPAGKEIPVYHGIARCHHCECRRRKRARLLHAGLIAVLASALVSSMPYRAPASCYRAPPTEIETIGRIAVGYGVPPDILLGVAFAESSFNRWAVSDDGLDHGMFQLRSLFAEERAEKWGEFDAFDPVQAARIASLILREHHARFGSWDKAIAAYNQGAHGVRRRGVKASYVARVRSYASF